MPIARPALLLVVLAIACRADAERMPRNTEVESYLAGYSKEYQRLNYASALAEWESNTHIVEGDSSNARRLEVMLYLAAEKPQGRKATLPDL